MTSSQSAEVQTIEIEHWPLPKGIGLRSSHLDIGYAVPMLQDIPGIEKVMPADDGDRIVVTYTDPGHVATITTAFQKVFENTFPDHEIVVSNRDVPVTTN